MRKRELIAQRDEAMGEATRLAELVGLSMLVLASVHVWCEHEHEQRTEFIDAISTGAGVPITPLVSQMLREHDLTFIAAAVDEDGAT